MINVRAIGTNQYVITTKRFFIFQSYDTIVSVIDKNDEQQVAYIVIEKFSRTTSKYLHYFLGTYSSTNVRQLIERPMLEAILDEDNL